MTFYSNFYAWLITQTNTNSPVGDFARDSVRDPDFPRAESSRRKIKEYLASRHVHDKVMEAFFKAWAQHPNPPTRPKTK